MLNAANAHIDTFNDANPIYKKENNRGHSKSIKKFSNSKFDSSAKHTDSYIFKPLSTHYETLCFLVMLIQYIGSMRVNK